MGWDKKGSWVSRMNNQKERPKTKTNMKYDAMKFRSWVIHAMPNEHNFPMDFFFDFQSTSNFNVVHWISTEWCKQNKIPSHKIWILFEHYENQTKLTKQNHQICVWKCDGNGYGFAIGGMIDDGKQWSVLCMNYLLIF